MSSPTTATTRTTTTNGFRSSRDSWSFERGTSSGRQQSSGGGAHHGSPGTGADRKQSLSGTTNSPKMTPRPSSGRRPSSHHSPGTGSERKLSPGTTNSSSPKISTGASSARNKGNSPKMSPKMSPSLGGSGGGVGAMEGSPRIPSKTSPRRPTLMRIDVDSTSPQDQGDVFTPLNLAPIPGARRLGSAWKGAVSPRANNNNNRLDSPKVMASPRGGGRGDSPKVGIARASIAQGTFMLDGSAWDQDARMKRLEIQRVIAQLPRFAALVRSADPSKLDEAVKDAEDRLDDEFHDSVYDLLKAWRRGVAFYRWQAAARAIAMQRKRKARGLANAGSQLRISTRVLSFIRFEKRSDTTQSDASTLRDDSGVMMQPPKTPIDAGLLTVVGATTKTTNNKKDDEDSEEDEDAVVVVDEGAIMSPPKIMPNNNNNQIDTDNKRVRSIRGLLPRVFSWSKSNNKLN